MTNPSQRFSFRGAYVITPSLLDGKDDWFAVLDGTGATIAECPTYKWANRVAMALDRAESLREEDIEC